MAPKTKAEFIKALGLSWHSGEGEFVVYDWESHNNGTAWDFYVVIQTYSDDSFSVYVQAPYAADNDRIKAMKEMCDAVAPMARKPRAKR